MPPASRRRPFFLIYALLRAMVAVLVLVVLVGVLGYCAALLLIDPNGYKPQIEAAVQRATGRTLALRGPLRLTFGVPPGLVAEDVALSNPAGASRQDMATLGRAEARLALRPLLSRTIDLTEVTLIHPDIRLERDSNGQPNWRFATDRAEAPTDLGGQQGNPPPAMPQPARWRLAVRSVDIEDGRIGWLPRPGAPVAEVTLPRVDATAGGPDGALRLIGSAVAGGRTLALTGEIGAPAHLLGSASAAPWPLRLSLHDDKASFELSGTIAEPQRGRGLSLQIDAAVTDFSGLDPFLGAWPMPRDAKISAQIGDEKGGAAGLTGITVHLGHPLPGALLPGVEIDSADLSAPALDKPVQIDIKGHAGIGALHLAANGASLGAVLPGAHPAAPQPMDLTLDAGQARITAKGTVADLYGLKGVDADLSAHVPEVAALIPLLGRPLPALSDVAFEGHVSGDVSATATIDIRHATLALPQAQISGDAELHLGPRPFVHAVVTAPRIDLDALLAALAQPWGATGQATAPAPAPAEAPASPPGPRRLILDTPIDVSPLDRMDADIEAKIDSLELGGAAYSQVAGTLKLRDGKAVADPLDVVLPDGGAADMKLSIDARDPALPVSLTLQAQSLRLASLSAALGEPGVVSGTYAVDAELDGAGHTLRAIVGSLDGHLGLHSVDAEVDNRQLPGLLRLAKLPELALGSGGTTKLRCLALRLDASKGVASVGALVADMPKLVVIGRGSVDLGQEQIALQLRPLLRVGGRLGGVVVPLRVSGSLLDPKLSPDLAKGGLAFNGGAGDPCVAALAAASGTAPPTPAPSPEAAVGKAVKNGAQSAIDTLKGLIK